MRLPFVGLKLAIVLGALVLDGPTSAETTSATVSSTLPAFAPPPVSGVDKTLDRPNDVDVLGVTDSHALLKLTRWGKSDSRYYAVLDLSTGCVVETYPEFSNVQKLVRSRAVQAMEARTTTPAQRQAKAARMLADPTMQAEIRRYLALRSRFGSRKDHESIYSGDFGWSADGSKIAVIAAEAFFRSRDGGQTYELLDTNMSREVHVTRDGRWAFYQRCGDANVHNYSCFKAQEVGIVDLTSAGKPRIVPVGRGTIEGLDPSGQKLLFVRDDEPGKVVATHLDPVTGTFTRSFSIPAPPLEAGTYFTISPSPSYSFGMFHHWISPRGARAILQSISVVNMTDGKIVHEQRQPFVGTRVDEDGRLAWGTVNSVRAFGTTPKGAIKDAGGGEPVGWAPGGRLIVFDDKSLKSATTLGEVACKVVRIRPIGS